ncbi:hypothetical protein [Hyphomicrobium sulfonivorans]|uniref:hypothetical protein n=1 Tax=Hyphomicrobium sulfonivorans TaxID=121290 RepID=UPI00156FAC6E|nr:hypothetical protein [Hyphomicrobium sulfonivorans]MBI1651384.1 hypothetical protein [Hyphomicrobium sulfonivorans]NSL73227.1 hypothetical protein [Hyphomicrobium sulfonivorans]
MTESPLSDLEKLRRLVIVIHTAARNLGYFRGARTMTHKDVSIHLQDIQRRIDNNFLDIGVFEWCKLFADRENQHWTRTLPTAQHHDFACGLYALAGTDEAGWRGYVDEFLIYRDKFLGHLDNRRTMNIPKLDRALEALHYYAQHLRQHHPMASTIPRSEFDVDRIVSDAMQQAQQYLP